MPLQLLKLEKNIRRFGILRNFEMFDVSLIKLSKLATIFNQDVYWVTHPILNF
jgi:hypothetical protein